MKRPNEERETFQPSDALSDGLDTRRSSDDGHDLVLAAVEKDLAKIRAEIGTLKAEVSERQARLDVLRQREHSLARAAAALGTRADLPGNRSRRARGVTIVANANRAMSGGEVLDSLRSEGDAGATCH